MKPLQIDLYVKNSWYNSKSDRGYTIMHKNDMPYFVLSYLKELKEAFPGNVTGFCGKNHISKLLMNERECSHLHFDEYGYQVSLNSLLKCFKKGGLIEGTVKTNDWATVRITKLGEEFLKYNVTEV